MAASKAREGAAPFETEEGLAGDGEAVRVVCRVRPPSSKELAASGAGRSKKGAVKAYRGVVDVDEDGTVSLHSVRACPAARCAGSCRQRG